MPRRASVHIRPVEAGDTAACPKSPASRSELARARGPEVTEVIDVDPRTAQVTGTRAGRGQKGLQARSSNSWTERPIQSAKYCRYSVRRCGVWECQTERTNGPHRASDQGRR